MVTEVLLNLIKGLFSIIINLIPEMSTFQLPNSFFTFLVEVFSMSAYILPVSGLMVIFVAWFALNTFHISWRTVQRIWDALPFT